MPCDTSFLEIQLATLSKRGDLERKRESLVVGGGPRELAREGFVVGGGRGDSGEWRAGVEEEGSDVGVVVGGMRYAAELLEELVGAPLAVVEGVAVEALAARAESQLISRI